MILRKIDNQKTLPNQTKKKNAHQCINHTKQNPHTHTSNFYRGASVATPDKVERTLSKVKPGKNEVDLNAFVGAAVGGRANTAFAAFSFVVIQIFVYGTLFIRPLINSLTGVDIGASLVA